MNILLVTSPHLDHTFFHRREEWTDTDEQPRLAQCFAPMGLISVAGAVDSPAEVEIKDINKAINAGILPMTHDFYDITAQWLLETDPDLIAFMTEADSYHHLLRIFESVKARRPNVLSLLGGPHASAVHHETLRDFAAVDFIIRGEGELAFQALIETLSSARTLEDVGNLTYREHSRIIVNPELPLISDLDNLPFPDFSRIALDPEDIIYVEIGRGCPFRCNFCFTAPYWKRKHRIKSPARIFKELVYFRDRYGRTDFNFTHDLFTTNRRWVIDFCQQLAESDIKVTWTCSSRTDTLDEEQIYWMQRAGCRNIYFGVEAGTPEMQTKIDKNLDLEEAKDIISKTSAAGIGVTVGFIAGLPGETDRTFAGTLDSAFHFLRLPNSTIHMFGFSPYRGSANYDGIAPVLLFDPHFVDLPLPQQLHAENCRLMKSHLDIFSRYSWAALDGNLRTAVASAAEEYFPMMNALRPLMMALDERGLDQFKLLSSWASWIAAKNKRRRNTPSRQYQGTIEEFLVFLKGYLQDEGQLDPVTEEMVHWEYLKNLLRSQTYNLNIPAMFITDQTIEHGRRVGIHDRGPLAPEPKLSTDACVYTNPSLMVEHFQHTDQFLADAENSGPGTFAFYVRRDGTAIIARLKPVVELILNLTKQGMPCDSLLHMLCSNAENVKPASLDALAALIEHLKETQLLLETVPVAS